MGIRAKMYVTNKTVVPPEQGGGFALRLCPVIEGSPENKEFYKYTPGGELTLQTINEQAAAQLEVGQEAYIDITPIERPQAAETAPAADSAPITGA